MKTDKQNRLGELADAIESRLQQGHLDDEFKALLGKMYGHLAMTSKEKSEQFHAGYQDGYSNGYEYGLDRGYEEGKLFSNAMPIPLARVKRQLTP